VPPHRAHGDAAEQSSSSRVANEVYTDSGCGIVEVGSFLGSSKQNRMVKEALSADFADQVTAV
jgi:hypothetical protein